MVDGVHKEKMEKATHEAGSSYPIAILENSMVEKP